MRRTTRFGLLLLLPLLAGPIACGGEPEEDAQEAIDRELDLAMADDSAELADVPEQEQAPAERPAAEPTRRQPAQTTPAPTRRPAERPRQQPAPDPGPSYVERTAPAGTSFQVTLNQELSTRTSQAGDLFTTTLTSPIMANGEEVIPAGATFRGEVTAVQASGGSGQPAVLKVAFSEVSFGGDTWPVALSVTEATPTTEGRSSTGEKAAKIGVGAAAGAILGRVIGGNKTGTLIGGAVGAAAGTAIALGGEDVDAVLAEGSPMTLRLDEPLTVRRET